MEKRKKVEFVDGQSLLPEAIIQHIQSFLSRKQAAQTSILSKSWYSAWSTRPNLDLDERDFGGDSRNRDDEIRFWNFAKKTMRRYEKSKLKIESFRLWMKGVKLDRVVVHYSYSLANELIVKAMKMGAIDLNFELQSQTRAFTLPHDVLGSKNLIRLSVAGCKIKLGSDGQVSCSRLKSLSFSRVYFEGDIIWDIISICPSIEKFMLSESSVLLKGQVFDNARTFSRSLGSVVNGPINLYKLHKLKCLSLGDVDVDIYFFRDLSSKFPCLKDLGIHYCGGYDKKVIEISSRSLECISFKQKKVFCAMFDVPNIRKFNFSGWSMPSLSFKTASMEWESDISIRCARPSTLWFLRLKKLLTSLRLSKISLSLNIKCIVEKSVDFQGLPETVVENLMMHAPSSVCSALLGCLFRSCRPKFITHYWLPKSCTGWKENNDFLEILCKRLIQVSQKSCILNQNMFGPCGLEEVNVELFEESLAEWQPLHWKILLDASVGPENKQKLRFQLRWGQDPSTFN